MAWFQSGGKTLEAKVTNDGADLLLLIKAAVCS
jgi:hypothetical protein